MDRISERALRSSAKKRVPLLGNYLILTDTEETEKNYFYGLRDSLPQECHRKIVIKVQKTDTKELIARAYEQAALLPQYSQVWIVFDRDQVKDFDEIITEAQSKDINVGWSNPCKEYI